MEGGYQAILILRVGARLLVVFFTKFSLGYAILESLSYVLVNASIKDVVNASIKDVKFERRNVCKVSSSVRKASTVTVLLLKRRLKWEFWSYETFWICFQTL